MNGEPGVTGTYRHSGWNPSLKVLKIFLLIWQGVLRIEKKKVKCPYCGHDQKVQYTPGARCSGVFIKCRGRHCGKEFEIKINQNK